MTDYCVFILSYNRCDNIKTLKSLQDCGYTGETYIIVGNDDPMLDDYKEKFEDHLLIFDKSHYMATIETISQKPKQKCVLYARRAAFDLAKEHGIDYFIELDDDYTSFEERTASGKKLLVNKIRDLDKAFSLTFDFLLASDADTVAWCQGGDFIGGAQNKRLKQQILRKAMNSFFCRTDRPLDFIGDINEDVNFYVIGNMQGKRIFSVVDASITQTDTQSNKGGMTDTYIEDGTWKKSFNSVICEPSCAKVDIMGDKHKRIHHKIEWGNCAPMIINEKYRKE